MSGGGLTRRQVLGTIGLAGIAGCIGHSEPGPVPPEVSFDVDVSDAAGVSGGPEYLSVTHRGGEALAADAVRVRVGPMTAYADGGIRSGFDTASGVVDEWSDGVSEGDRVVLSTGGPLPYAREVTVSARSESEYYRRATATTPPPAVSVSAVAGRIDEEGYLTVTYEEGDPVDVADLSVSLAGTSVYRERSFTAGYGSGSAALDEWRDGLDAGDRLRVHTGESLPTGEPLEVLWVPSDRNGPWTAGETTVAGPGGLVRGRRRRHR